MLDALNPVPILLAFSALAFFPLAIILTTSFIKISVVLMLLRNALGLQQVPPNIVIYSVALVAVVFTMQPLLVSLVEAVMRPGQEFSSVADWQGIYDQAKGPLKAFMLKFADETERQFFYHASQKLWNPELAANVKDTDLPVLIPSFVVSELKRAFQIGFLIFIPFVVIDLIVSNILIALGAIMVSPMTISLPIKLLLFVLVDGWTKLMHGLVLSYA